jgi:hypothetical protein
MIRESYWKKTTLQAVVGGVIGVGAGFAVGVVYALIQLHDFGSLHSETVPTVFWVPLFVIGIAGGCAIAGAVLGAVVGYLAPVPGGPPFLRDQLPLKLILLSLVFGSVYLGIFHPRLAERRKEQDFRSALSSQDASEVRKSVEKGVKLDIPVGDGTPLISAAQQGNLEICRYLLSQGAEVNRKNLQGETALIVALKNTHPEVAQELVDSGADVNLPDSHGQTPLMLAAALNSTSIVEALLAKHAEINHVILYGSYSPLIAAVTYHRVQNVEVLLRSGADPNLAPPGAPSPLTQARIIGDQPIVDLLTAQAAK